MKDVVTDEVGRDMEEWTLAATLCTLRYCVSTLKHTYRRKYEGSYPVS